MSNPNMQQSDDSYSSFCSDVRSANSTSSFHNNRPNFRRSSGNYQNYRPHNHSTPYNNRNNRGAPYNARNSAPYRRPYQHREQNQSNDKKPAFDVAKYFNPSMLENPWAELEEKLNDVSDDSSSGTCDCSECSECSSESTSGSDDSVKGDNTE